MPYGWIKLHRQILRHDFFQEERVFSKFEAWVDLLIRANYKDRNVLVNGQLVEVKRGQHLTSMKQLAERWGWSRSKVDRFFSVLEMDHMLNTKRTSKYTLITIVNYDFYQSTDSPTDIKRTSNEHQTDTNKKEERKSKKGEEEKNHFSPTLLEGGRLSNGHEESHRPPTNFKFFK